MNRRILLLSLVSIFYHCVLINVNGMSFQTKSSRYLDMDIAESSKCGQVFVCTNKYCREKGSDATMATFSFLCPQVRLKYFFILLLTLSFLVRTSSKCELSWSLSWWTQCTPTNTWGSICRSIRSEFCRDCGATTADASEPRRQRELL